MSSSIPYNKGYIKSQIEQKNNYSRAYYATNNTVKHSITDFDVFPFTRWYRGVYQDSEPVIIEREAGYRRLENDLTSGFVSHNTNDGDSSYAVQAIRETFAPLPTVTGKQVVLDNNYLNNLCWQAAPSTVFPCYSKLSPDNKEIKISLPGNPVNISD